MKTVLQLSRKDTLLPWPSRPEPTGGHPVLATTSLARAPRLVQERLLSLLAVCIPQGCPLALHTQEQGDYKPAVGSLLPPGTGPPSHTGWAEQGGSGGRITVLTDEYQSQRPARQPLTGLTWRSTDATCLHISCGRCHPMPCEKPQNLFWFLPLSFKASNQSPKAVRLVLERELNGMDTQQGRALKHLCFAFLKQVWPTRPPRAATRSHSCPRTHTGAGQHNFAVPDDWKSSQILKNS